MRINVHWPYDDNKRSGCLWNPRYVIAWRVMWLPLLMPVLGLLLLLVCCSFGPKTARETWECLR